MNIADIRSLYAYNLWANDRLFSALSKISNEQFIAPVQSSFPSVRDTVFHIFGAEWLWLKRWQGLAPRASAPISALSPATWKLLTPVGMSTIEELSTVPALQSFADSIEHERSGFLDAQNDDSLHAPLHFNDMAGTPHSDPLGELMQHVVNHSTYHRGQVTTMLRQLGAEAISLDMLYFFRETRQKAAGA